MTNGITAVLRDRVFEDLAGVVKRATGDETADWRVGVWR